MLRNAYNSGMAAALARFKLAVDIRPGTLGGDTGVAPTGEEQSHGTQLNAYPTRPGGAPTPSAPDKEHNSDFLWGISNYDNWAPGAVGEWGQETIG